MKNKLIIAALLFVPMSAYAGGFPDPFEASNTAKDAYNWIQQAIPEMAQTRTEASNAILDEQVLQMNVNTDFANAKDYTNQAVNGIIGEANSNAAVSIKAADREQDAEVNKSLAQAQTDANGALSSALSSSAKGDATTLASANSYANTIQSNAEGYAMAGDKTTLTSANQTSANGDASTLDSANQTSANGDKTTLAQANSYATAGDKSTLTYANQDSQIMANAAQSSSESYTNQSYQQANANAQGYAQQAQNNAETFAQGAANQAQLNANQYAASGIAAALAMPSSPYLEPGHYAVGIQAATYGGEQGFGARATFQINDHWSANAGVAGGTGIYGQVGGTVGVQYEG